MSLVIPITTVQLSHLYCMHAPSRGRPLAALSGRGNQAALHEAEQAQLSMSGSLEGVCFTLSMIQGDVQRKYISHASQQAKSSSKQGLSRVVDM